MSVIEIAVSDVVFRKDLYPRIETNAVTVQKYAEDLEVLPPIEVNQLKELIDGWHRWTAHKKAKADKIKATVTKTASDAELLELAIERNATHGLQLSQEDKKGLATKLYNATPNRKDRMELKPRLAKMLSISEDLLSKWLSRSEKDMKDAAKREAFNLWLACKTFDEISENISWPKRTIADWMSGLCGNREITEIAQTKDSEGEKAESPFKLTEAEIAAANHSTDFAVPLYNVWKQQEKTSGSNHFGNSEVRWLDNLLYLYTKPLDIVIDPFAGGGSTIDLCRKRFRRYWVGDRKPVVERESEIRQHDLTDGLPDLKGRWGDVRLVYLDPPYWKQAEGQYSKDKTDLANMPLEQFNETLAGIIKGFASKLKDAYIALIIQPTQWKAPERQFTDHVADMLRAVKLPVDMRFSVPYESQQCTAQMVEWAKKNRRCLVLSREIVVWRI